MQWTTGDASDGVNGFVDFNDSTGSPAVVGASNADGVNYIQFGQFGIPGDNFTGSTEPFPYSGVSWLDNKIFVFNACFNDSNIAPIFIGPSHCDTIHIGCHDTLDLSVSFISPESGQITTSSATSYDGLLFSYFSVRSEEHTSELQSLRHLV